MLTYAAVGSAVFAALFSAFTVLRADPEDPCPWDTIISRAEQPAYMVTNNHPPPYRSRATEPLANCVSVLRREPAAGPGEVPWPDAARYALLMEAAALGLSAVSAEARTEAPDELVVAYTTFCAHRTEITARLTAALHAVFPDGPRLIDVTETTDTQAIVMRQALPLWPESVIGAVQ